MCRLLGLAASSFKTFLATHWYDQPSPDTKVDYVATHHRFDTH
jgi:hypothetical protein